MTRAFVLAAIVALAASASAAPEPTAVLVDHSRLLLSDVMPSAPAALAKTDLGPAPPAGSSVLLTRDSILGKLGDAGATVALPPGTIRVSSASKTMSARELSDWLKPMIASRMRTGVTLARVDGTVGATLSPRALVKDVSVPRTHQKGTQQVTAVVELARDGETVLKMPVTLTLDVDERGARADVPRGSHVTVIVRAGHVEVHADATTTTDGDVGDLVQLTVARTARAASGKLLDDKTVALVERP